jgi:hypothetical protein
VLRGDVKPLLSEVVSRPRPLLSVDLARVAVRPRGRNATAASETLGWLLFRSRGAGGLLRKLVVYLEACGWRASRAIGTPTSFVCDAKPQLLALRQDMDK